MRVVGLIILSCFLCANTFAGVIISKAEVEQSIRKEFIEQGIVDTLELEIFGGKANYEYKDAQDAKIMLSGLEIENEQGRFSVTAEIFADGELKDKSKIIGRYFVLQDAWVPSHDIKKEDIIKKDDLQKIKVRSNRLRAGAIWQKDEIVGKQAARGLKSGKILDKDDLQALIIVKKGQIVTAVYNKKGLQITSKMQALSSAAKGETVKLLNMASKKEVIGLAKDADIVEIISQ